LGESPLNQACLAGNLPKAECLFQHGTDPDGDGLLLDMP
jgi:hypothetical protein